MKKELIGYLYEYGEEYQWKSYTVYPKREERADQQGFIDMGISKKEYDFKKKTGNWPDCYTYVDGTKSQRFMNGKKVSGVGNKKDYIKYDLPDILESLLKKKVKITIEWDE